MDGFTLYEQEVNEHLCLVAAGIAGLSAAQSRVLAFGSERAIVLTRHDRRQTTGGWIRVHQEDACQALSVMPGRKYQSDGGLGARQIVDLFRRTIQPDDAETDVLRFADKAMLHDRVLALCAVAPDAFAQAASDPAVVALGGYLPGRLVSAVSTRAKECARLLDER